MAQTRDRFVLPISIITNPVCWLSRTFCLVQTLAYQGYIQVDWRRVERDYLHILDTDQDGQVRSSDLASVVNKTVARLPSN